MVTRLFVLLSILIYALNTGYASNFPVVSGTNPKPTRPTGVAMLSNTDGSFVVVGTIKTTEPAGTPGAFVSGYYIEKYDSSGTVLWTTYIHYDTSTFTLFVPHSIVTPAFLLKVNGGGYLIVGDSSVYNIACISCNLFQTHIDENGNLISIKYTSLPVNCTTIQQVRYGNAQSSLFLLANSYYFFHIDLNGVMLSSKQQTTGLYRSLEVVDDTFVVAINATSIEKMNGHFTIIWSKSLHEPYTITGPSMVTENNHGQFFVGVTAIPVNSKRLISLSKFDSAGNFIWKKTFSRADYSEFKALTLVGDTIYITGTVMECLNADSLTTHCSGLKQLYIVRLDSSGNKLHDFIYHKSGTAIQPFQDTLFCNAGINLSYNSALTSILVLDNQNKTNSILSGSSGLQILQTEPDSVLIHRFSLNLDSSYSYNGITTAQKQTTVVHLFPNPTHDEIQISCELPIPTTTLSINFYNTMGQLAFSRIVPYNPHVELKSLGLPEGTYMYRIVGANELLGAGKLVIAY